MGSQRHYGSGLPIIICFNANNYVDTIIRRSISDRRGQIPTNRAVRHTWRWDPAVLWHQGILYHDDISSPLLTAMCSNKEQKFIRSQFSSLLSDSKLGDILHHGADNDFVFSNPRGK
jgi:hypothetical protein